MARRQLLTDEQWTRLLAPPSDEREIVRYWTLSREDFDIIFRKRSDHSRLGFALLLCYNGKGYAKAMSALEGLFKPKV